MSRMRGSVPLGGHDFHYPRGNGTLDGRESRATAAPVAPPAAAQPAGARARRRPTRLGLAVDAGVSTRHLSVVETGRSRPSEQMVLHLAEQLEVPLRERNRLLLAAGYAPVYSQRPLDQLGPVKGA